MRTTARSAQKELTIQLTDWVRHASHALQALQRVPLPVMDVILANTKMLGVVEHASCASKASTRMRWIYPPADLAQVVGTLPSKSRSSIAFVAAEEGTAREMVLPTFFLVVKTAFQDGTRQQNRWPRKSDKFLAPVAHRDDGALLRKLIS